MAVAEAVEPDHAMRALSLFGVLVLAKTLMLSGRILPLSLWSPFVFF